LRNVVLLMMGRAAAQERFRLPASIFIVTIEERLTRDLRNALTTARSVGPAVLPSHESRADHLAFDERHRPAPQSGDANLADAMSSTLQAPSCWSCCARCRGSCTLVTLLSLRSCRMWDRFRRRLHAGVMRVWDAIGEISSHVQETMSGIRLVKASGAEPFESERSVC